MKPSEIIRKNAIEISERNKANATSLRSRLDEIEEFCAAIVAYLDEHEAGLSPKEET